jgi:Na+/H+ antiporter NhaC
MEEFTANYGVLSLLPVAIIFIVSIATKHTLFAMFCGVLSGAIFLSGGLAAIPETLFGYLYQTMGNETWQWITLVVVLFGILTALFEQSGAVMEFGLCVRRFIKTKRQALFGTFIFGLIVFVDDYLSNLTVGVTMRKITDTLKIPRTQLGYIVNLMAGPISLLIPISSWTAAFAGMFEAEGIMVNGSAVTAFIHSIPLIFYAWVALIVCLLQIFGILPRVGMIRRDTIRAEKTGDLFPVGTETPPAVMEPETASPRPWNFLIPMAVVVVVTLLSELDILVGGTAGCLAAFFLYLIERKMTFTSLLKACFDGVVMMSFPLILFILAFSVNAINDAAGMPPYVISLVQPLMKGAFLPVVVFIACAIYAFFTGACWDLAMIIMPIVAPLAIAIGVDPIFAGAAVISGSLFGNVLCPYGDGVILCSQSCQIRPIDLMLAISPYMLISGIITALIYLVTGFIFI